MFLPGKIRPSQAPASIQPPSNRRALPSLWLRHLLVSASAADRRLNPQAYLGSSAATALTESATGPSR